MKQNVLTHVLFPILSPGLSFPSLPQRRSSRPYQRVTPPTQQDTEAGSGVRGVSAPNFSAGSDLPAGKDGSRPIISRSVQGVITRLWRRDLGLLERRSSDGFQPRDQTGNINARTDGTRCCALEI